MPFENGHEATDEFADQLSITGWLVILTRVVVRVILMWTSPEHGSIHAILRNFN
jgi:hypothetical protein